ncbi:DUF2971 domain-containing protein [Chryseobacterium wangxinyae]|uniref:DUF2971 domain-containing protein n=1 Tax=Chryseobacterium sp. CY350 TaxID=2997336 RepID=UPI0022714786|nr:DUF2971 domain-containing protein [Chryseobacterium sp. CY350]MCY0978896.1 DUF2971 domain-containing protein [Chryseobacterium sp. CY350]WBZ93727.1 DUF2971 domain-containing protein [Chryseobacterium sp. CY350]
MNDATELKWARDLFLNTLKAYKNEFTQDFRFAIINSVFTVDNYVLPLIGCFSFNGDLLSQWRAYADDGKGFSIGFSSNLIQQGLGVNIQPISYDLKEQKEIIIDSLKELFIVWKENKKLFLNISKGFSIDLNYLKNPHFKEEAEVRIVRLIVKDQDSLKYHDVGGNSEINKIQPLSILERERNGQKIKFIKLPITIPNHQIIKEIILGPKSTLDYDKVKKLLEYNNFKNVKIKKSQIPYR